MILGTPWIYRMAIRIRASRAFVNGDTVRVHTRSVVVTRRGLEPRT